MVEMPVLPIANRVLAPKMAQEIRIRSQRAMRLARESQAGVFLVVAQRDPMTQTPGPRDLYAVGTIARIVAARWAGAEAQLKLNGITRARIGEFTASEPFLRAKVQPIDDSYDRGGDEESLSALRRSALALLAQDLSYSPALRRLVTTIVDPHHLAELLAANLLHTVTEQQIILEAKAPPDRIARMLRHLQRLEANPESRPLSQAEKWRRLWRAIKGLFE